MTARDEHLLLRAVDRAGYDGAWLCEVRDQVRGSSGVRVQVGLQRLVDAGLVRVTSGAYGMATYRLTLEGNYRLRRPPPRSYARAA